MQRRLRKKEREAVQAIYSYVADHKHRAGKCPFIVTVLDSLRLLLDGNPERVQGLIDSLKETYG